MMIGCTDRLLEQDNFTPWIFLCKADRAKLFYETGIQRHSNGNIDGKGNCKGHRQE